MNHAVIAAGVRAGLALLDIVEAHARQRQRAKALSAPHRRIVRMLRARWKSQLKLILEHQTLRNLPVREAIPAEVSAAILRALLPGAVQAALAGLVSEAEIEIFNDALRVAFGAGAAQTALDLGKLLSAVTLDQPQNDWIRDHGFDKIAADIDRSTIAKLRDAVGKAYADGGSYDDLVRTIRKTFDGFSDDRADLIAQTELNAAYNRGGLEFAKGVGAQGKKWNPLGDNVCEICLANESESVIAVRAAFASGHESPPAHPRCQCVLDFTFLPLP